MNRRSAVITGVFLSITGAAVGMEVWFATDHDPDTLPWTTLLVRYVPAPITFAAITVLVSFLMPHFIEAYAKRKRTTMDTTSIPATPDPGSAKEPLLSVGTVTAVASAAVAVAVAFGLHLSDAQTGAVLTLVAVVAPFIVAIVGRSKSFAPATVRAMVVEAAASGEVKTGAAVVAAEKPDVGSDS